MTDGQNIKPISEADLLEDYYDNLHNAHDALRATFGMRGVSQDELAILTHCDKSIISKRLNGKENLTLKSLSYMASGLRCRLHVLFEPYEQIPATNYYWGWNSRNWNSRGPVGSATPPAQNFELKAA